jgi:DNA-binding helix-hairpin-helix protein with protein kinase domain
VNDRVTLVTDRALVRLIDCDGFQLTHKGRTHTCDVGVPTHQPPELQGKKSFRGLVRTQNHDNFGLAVLVFQLLFLARHPFSGTYAEGAMPLERAIQEHRFVYGAEAAKRGMTPPPCSLARPVPEALFGCRVCGPDAEAAPLRWDRIQRRIGTTHSND